MPSACGRRPCLTCKEAQFLIGESTGRNRMCGVSFHDFHYNTRNARTHHASVRVVHAIASDLLVHEAECARAAARA